MAAESYATRIARIISANINKGVDFLENRSADGVLAEAVREVDEILQDVRHELGKKISERHHYAKKLSELNNEHEKLSAQSGLAIKEGRDDLARAAVTKMLNIEAQLPVLEQSVVESQNGERELNSHIQALIAKKKELEDEYNEFVRHTKADPVTGDEPVASASGDVDAKISERVEKAESVFDRVYAASLGINRSQVAVGADDARRLAELQELETNNRIDERLKKIRTELTE